MGGNIMCPDKSGTSTTRVCGLQGSHHRSDEEVEHSRKVPRTCTIGTDIMSHGLRKGVH